jgi:phospholipase/lecithinase/hemolysin
MARRRLLQPPHRTTTEEGTMHPPRWIAGVAAAALLPALLATAQSVDFSQTVTFGDSLTHNWLLGLPFRTALYGDDPMEAVFDRGAVAGDRLTDYAIPGAASNSMLAQIGVYALRRHTGAQGRGTMFSFEIGGNDVLDGWSRLSANPPGVDPAADDVITRLIHRIGSDLVLLWTTHRSARFVVWTIPDITFTPRHWSDRNTTRGVNFRAHLARVNSLLRVLDMLPNVAVFDTEAFLRASATNPPVVLGRQLTGPPASGAYSDLFADSIHPTAVANALVANEIIGLMNARWGAGIQVYTEADLARLARIP